MLLLGNRVCFIVSFKYKQPLILPILTHYVWPSKPICCGVRTLRAIAAQIHPWCARRETLCGRVSDFQIAVQLLRYIGIYRRSCGERVCLPMVCKTSDIYLNTRILFKGCKDLSNSFTLVALYWAHFPVLLSTLIRWKPAILLINGTHWSFSYSFWWRIFTVPNPKVAPFPWLMWGVVFTACVVGFLDYDFCA